MFVHNSGNEFHKTIDDNKQRCSCIILIHRVKPLKEVFYVVEFGVYILKMV
jgi:hypothetical protein